MAGKEMEVGTGEKVAWQTAHNRYRSKTVISTLEVPQLAEESSYRCWIEMRKTSIAFVSEKDGVANFAKYLKVEVVIWRGASQLSTSGNENVGRRSQRVNNENILLPCSINCKTMQAMSQLLGSSRFFFEGTRFSVRIFL